MKNNIIFKVILGLAVTLLLIGVPEVAHASDFHVTGDLTWASKYMTDGFKVAGDSPVWQPSVEVGLPVTGVSLMFWSALQVDRSKNQFDELDFMGRYGHVFFSEMPYAFHLHGSYDYWLYPNVVKTLDEFGNTVTAQKKQGDKLSAGISLPSLIPLADSYLIPSYNAYYWVYWADNRTDQYQGGARHELLLQYSHLIPNLIPGTKAHYLGASGSANYHDGVFNIQPGWSYSSATFFSSVYALGSIFTLSVNRQWAFRSTVNPGTDTWSTLSFSKTF